MEKFKRKVKALAFFLTAVFYCLAAILPALAVASQTTLYFGSHEKVVDQSGGVVEEKSYLALPHVTVMKAASYSYLYQDHLASTRLITDNRGQPVGEYDYYPYGSAISYEPPAVSDKLYTSQTKDDSTDLYYYHARYYNPAIASFLSADSAEGPNRYAYVAGNPINANDPTGNQEEGPLGSSSNPCWDSQVNLVAQCYYTDNYFTPGGIPIRFARYNQIATTEEMSPRFQGAMINLLSRLPEHLKKYFGVFIAYEFPEEYKNQIHTMNVFSVATNEYTYDRTNIILDSRLFTASQENLAVMGFHEITHTFQDRLMTDYLTRNGPVVINNFKTLAQGEEITFSDTVRYLMRGRVVVREPETVIKRNFLTTTFQTSLPLTSPAFTSRHEFEAHSFSAYIYNNDYFDYYGYRFPFNEEVFRPLADFYGDVLGR